MEEIAGIFNRCTLGIDATDGSYNSDQAYEVEREKLWGAYHFGRQGEDPVKQADWFLSHVKSGKEVSGKVLLALDIEFYPLDYEKKKIKPHFMSIDDAILFSKRVEERTGKRPGLYVGSTYLREYLRGAKLSKQVTDELYKSWLWLPRYYAKTKLDEIGNLIPSVPSSLTNANWTFWQHSESDNENPKGVFFSGKIGDFPADRDVFNGSPEQLQTFWKRNAWDYKFVK